MKIEFILIGFGAILGAILSFGATEISACRQRKIEEFNKKTNLTNEIVSDTLKFIFKANDILLDVFVNKLTYLKAKETHAEEAHKKEQIMYESFDEHIKKEFFDERNFHSYQLQRLENKELWKEFATLMETLKTLIDMLLKDEMPKEYEEVDSRYKNLLKDFVSHCIEITKI